MSKCREMSSCAPRGSSSASAGERGVTLAELLVVLAILSILAAVAVPFAETAVERRKEQALRASLREVRTAIDRFHDDWRAGVFADDIEGISENGFPVELALLVEGLEDIDGGPKRYLRRVPENPFAPSGAAEWLYLGYADPPDATIWNQEDIYDIRAITGRTALDGSEISDW